MTPPVSFVCLKKKHKKKEKQKKKNTSVLCDAFFYFRFAAEGIFLAFLSFFSFFLGSSPTGDKTVKED